MYHSPPSSLSCLHPAAWNAAVMAGILIAILDPEDKRVGQRVEGDQVSEDCAKPLYRLWTACLRNWMTETDLLLLPSVVFNIQSLIRPETDQKIDRR